MTRWFTADLHFGHANIIRYCDRPFPDVAAMDDGLVERWNAVVADGDEVWVLGDVAMGTITESLGRVGRLAGTKLLVPGNHDRCWPGHGAKAQGWVARYIDAGFADVLGEQVELTFGECPALACHFPYLGDSHDEDRFDAHRPTDDGRTLLHGHVHTRWRIEGHQVNVGCDVWGYRPVSEAELLATLETDASGGAGSSVIQDRPDQAGSG